jgi:hypothetical protein
MTEQETGIILLMIKKIYKRFEPDDITVKIWHMFLKNLPFEKAQKHLVEHIAVSSFEPGINNILRYDHDAALRRHRQLSDGQQQEFAEFLDNGGAHEDFEWAYCPEDKLPTPNELNELLGVERLGNGTVQKLLNPSQ